MMEVVAQRVSSPVLVGRAAEAARLGAAFERAAAGQATVVVVAGEAGVGKTRLVAELADRVRRRGALALAGGCLDVGDGVVAYAPVVEALRPLPGLLAPEELERVLGGARAELARLVPELAAPDTTPPGEAVATVPGRLFELLLGVVHRLAERGPVLLVVEDLHWADRSTRDLLGFLVRNLRGAVALVLTYRTDELHRRHPLRPFLAELERGGRAERLELGRLDRRELAELLGGILGEPADPGLVEEILARSEGNPFFAEELLAARREGSTCRRRCGTCCWRACRCCRRPPSAACRSPPWRASGSTTSCWPRSPGSRPSGWSSHCGRRSAGRSWWSRRAAAPTGSATPWCRRRSTTTCCRCSAARCTPPTPARSAPGSSGAAAARPPPSSASSPITGTSRTTRGGRCWPACGRGRRPRPRSRWPRRCGTTSAPWSCGSWHPRRPPAARWTGARCCSGPRRPRSSPARPPGRSP
jgi:hypothetical protein